MNILEKEIEQLIWSAIQEEKFDLLWEKGLPLESQAKYYRQLNLGSYGILDIASILINKIDYPQGLTHYEVWINIIELKKNQVNMDTFKQVLAYARYAQLIFEEYESRFPNKDFRLKLKLSLIGKTIDDKSHFCFLSSIFSNVNIYTYELDFSKGLTFNSHDSYSLSGGHSPINIKLSKKNIIAL